MFGFGKYGRLFFLLYLVVSKTLTAQETRFIEVPVEPVLIEKGEYKNYYKYDLGEYIFWKGRYENNLRFKIQNKVTRNIEFDFVDSISDAMILIPKFFGNADNSTQLIMVEVAVEYSWEQQVVLIKDQTVNYLGYMNYAVLGEELEESISDYSIITSSQDRIWLTFEDVKIVDYSDEDKIIDGNEMKFELGENGIRRVQ
jgi:hypothetical protein